VGLGPNAGRTTKRNDTARTATPRHTAIAMTMGMDHFDSAVRSQRGITDSPPGQSRDPPFPPRFRVGRRNYSNLSDRLPRRYIHSFFVPDPCSPTPHSYIQSHVPPPSLLPHFRSYMTATAASAAHPPQAASHSQPPQPGDGAFLAASIPAPAPRPGDGAYLANAHSYREASRRNGRGAGQRGGKGDGRRGGDTNGRPQSAPVADGLTQHGDVSTSTSQEGNRNVPGQTGNRPPRQRRQPRADAAVRAATATAMPNGHSAQRPNAPLDPSAPSFAPLTAQMASLSVEPQHLTPVTAPSSSASSDVQGQRRERSERGGRRAGRGDRNARGGRGGKTPLSETQVRSEPTAKPGISSRRAAFEQQTKLTTTVSRTSDGSSGAARRLSVDQEQVKEYRAKHRRREKEAEKDDLISRLTRGLGRKPFLECPIVCPSLQAVSDELSKCMRRIADPVRVAVLQLDSPITTHLVLSTPNFTARRRRTGQLLHRVLHPLPSQLLARLGESKPRRGSRKTTAGGQGGRSGMEVPRVSETAGG
jgi:hypothetical protein